MNSPDYSSHVGPGKSNNLQLQLFGLLGTEFIHHVVRSALTAPVLAAYLPNVMRDNSYWSTSEACSVDLS